METQALAPITGNTLATIERLIEIDPNLRSPNTRRGYRNDLAQFEDWRDGRPLSKLLVEQYISEMQAQGMAPRTIKRVQAAIRWWARKVADLAWEDASLSPTKREEIVKQALRVASIRDVKSDEGEGAKTGRHIERWEVDALMRACARDESPAAFRDAAIIALAHHIGPRVSEISRLQFADWEPAPGGSGEGILTIRKSKGGKTRRVYINNGAAIALGGWLIRRGKELGPLFYAIRKGGHIAQGKGLSTEALRLMLEERQRQASLSKPLTWHDFRRSFAGEMLEVADVSIVQKLMGHSSSATTTAYDRRPEETRRQAMRKRETPYYVPGTITP